MKQIGILLTFLLFSLQYGHAATYHVSIGGNDGTGDGSAGKPWRTLQHAVSRVPGNQGHTIKLSGGTFVENAFINIPTGVNIEGSGIGVTILKPTSNLYFQSSAWVFDKYLLNLSGGGAGNQSIKDLTINGDSKRLYGGILIRDRTNVLIQRVRVEYCYYTGIWIWNSKDSRITESQFKDNAYGSSAGASASIYLSLSEQLEIDNNNVDEAHGRALNAVVSGKMYNTKIHDNRFSVSPKGNWQTPTGHVVPNICVELYNVDMRGVEVYNNYFDNNLSVVMSDTDYARSGVKTVRIHNNVFDLVTRANGSGHALELMVHDAEVDHNYIWGGSSGIANWEGPGRPSRKNWKIHHNVFYALSSGYPTSAINFYNNGIDDAHIYNNTLETVGSSTVSFIEVANGGVVNNLRADNNLIIDSNNSYQWHPNNFINLVGGSRVQNSFARNNFLQKAVLNTVGGITYSNNKSGDPQIQRSSSRPFPYYASNPGSPLIDAGIQTGSSYAGSTPDIGAHENGLSSTPINNGLQVNITAPVANAVFTAGQTITISSTATHSNGTISKVEFFQGSTKLGEDATSPYSYNWSNATPGTYAITAKATDDKGVAQTSTPVSIQVKGVFEIPGLIQAQDYHNMSGVQTETTTDTGGGLNVGWIETGDWMEYDVKVATAGKYTVQYRVASEVAGGGIELKSGTTTLATTEFPATAGWQNWTTLSADVNLSAGMYTLRLVATKGAFNLNWLEFKNSSGNTAPVVRISAPANESVYEAPAEIILTANATDDGTVTEVAFYNGETLLGKDTSAPFSFTWKNVAEGTYTVTAKATDDKGASTTSSPLKVQVNTKAVAIAIPGTIEAENYTAMSGINTETTTDTGGGKNVGWFETGDWLDFNVNVAEAGKHSVKYRVASQNTGGILEIKTGSSILATTQIEATSGWQIWKTIETTADLQAGVQTIRLSVKTGAVNVNWVGFEKTAEVPSATLGLPGIIQAEAFAEQNGIQFAPSNDEDGTHGAGWIDAGDWLQYNVDVKQAGAFKIEYRVASVAGGGSIDLYTGNTKLLSTPMPSTGGWESWTTVEEMVTLNAGVQTLKIVAPIGGFNINWINFSQSSVPTIPGVIEAESFSKMDGVRTESTTDEGGGENVGWMESGDWLEYVVNVSKGGAYTVKYRVATGSPQGATMQLKSGPNLLSTVAVPLTGGWQKWTSIYSTVNLTQGVHTLRLDNTSGAVNLNWIEFSPVQSIAPFEIPGKIEAENYTAMSGMQSEDTEDTGSGKNMGWTDRGDWLEYELNVASAGSYRVDLRVSSQNGNGSLQLKSGATVLSTTAIPSTGGWQEWTTVSTTVSLPPGKQILRMEVIAGGFNINWMQFSSSSVIQATSAPALLRIFSPNNDGINDTWQWSNDDNQAEDCVLSMFNQSGKKLYEATSSNTTWDGTSNGQPLQDGVYYYIINCGGEETTGAVQIVR